MLRERRPQYNKITYDQRESTQQDTEELNAVEDRHH
jgi:hypothetical protein